MASKKSKKNGAPAKGAKKTKKKEQAWTAGANPKPVGGAPAQETLQREKHGKPYTRELPTDASASELAFIAHQLSSVVDEEELVKQEKREANAVFREKLAGLTDQKKKLSACVKSDKKLEPVQVQEWIRADNLIEVIRLDTMEVIETRTATSEDLQREIQAEGVHEKKDHKKLVETDDDDDDDEECPECHEVGDVHKDDCPTLKPKAETEPAPPPEGTETGELAAETASE